MKKIILQLRSHLARHNPELVVDHLGPRNGPARRNQVLAPLKHKCRVPKDESSNDQRDSANGSALTAKQRSSAFEQNTESKNKQWRYRNEEPVSERRDAGPVRIARNKNVERQHSSQQWGAHTRLAPLKKHKPGGGEKKQRRPRKQAVFGEK